MDRLNEILSLQKGDCVALLGSGGKTTLMYTLAKTAPMDTILVSTTTKICMPPDDAYDYFVLGEELISHLPASGRTLAVCRGEDQKLSAPSEAVLQEAYQRYALSVLECDGSRNLPLKGWAVQEPVIPSFVTVSIGIMPLWPLGKPASETLIHRFPLFSQLTGLRMGQTIEAKHLLRAITSERGKGLFSSTCGRQILFFNQVESDDALQTAKQIVDMLPSPFRNRLDMAVAGSAKNNQALRLPL